MRRRNFCPDKFSNLSHHAAAPPRAGPLSRKTTPGQRHPQIAPNERRSVGPKCGPSRLRVRSPTSDSPSARGRRGLVREGRDSVLATDLAHHRLEADGVGHAGTRRARSLSHKERTTHQSPSRARHSVRPIGHLRATRAIHQDPTSLAGVGESDLWLTRGPAAHLPNLPRNDARSTQPGWTRKREGVRVKGPRPWGRTSRFVRALRVHPQQPLPWAAHDVHKHPP